METGEHGRARSTRSTGQSGVDDVDEEDDGCCETCQPVAAVDNKLDSLPKRIAEEAAVAAAVADADAAVQLEGKASPSGHRSTEDEVRLEHTVKVIAFAC